jgi:PAS domain S-box-containing protein
VGIAHVGLDGRWLRVNERTCAITGYTRDELLRTTFMQITHPDDVERDWEHARRLLAGEIHTYSIEKRYMRKDGASVPIELTVSLARTPAGEPNYFISVIQEIEERARAEQALRESEERFRTLADNISQFAWMADAQGALFWYNRRWYDFTGTTFDEMQGWGWQKVHHPEHVQRVVEKFRGHIERGEVWEDTFPLRGKDGAYRWFLSRAVPIRDAAGRVVRWFGTNTDITELREVEQRRDELLDSERAARSEAERAARVKDEFLATLSHELRTPLAAILGWAQIVRRGRLAGEDINDAFKIIEDNARLQKQLIEDLLDMSRIASGKMKIDAQPVNLATVAEEAVAMIRPAAEEKGLRLVTRLDGSGGNVLGDAGRLKQVIGNLLSNAVKFTPAGGQIRVVLHHKAGRALLAVRDTGIGMAPEFVPQLFERFRQADASSTRKYRGLGLGLALVRQLTELHGGTVRATSRGAGRGSTFVIEMPLLRGLTPPQRAEAAAQVAFDFDLRHVAALVVDDEPTTRALITRILKEAGAAVTDCPGAAEALEAMAARTYDVIVSDISMPGIDGYMLLREVRSLPDRERALIPAVAVTAFSRDDDRRRAYEAGYQTHLTKPIEPAELCAIVANLVRREAASPDRA